MEINEMKRQRSQKTTCGNVESWRKSLIFMWLPVFTVIVFNGTVFAEYFYSEVEEVDSTEDVILMRPIPYDPEKESKIKMRYDEDTEFFVADSAADIKKSDQISMVADSGPTEEGVWHADTIRRMYYEGG